MLRVIQKSNRVMRQVKYKLGVFKMLNICFLFYEQIEEVQSFKKVYTLSKTDN